MACSEVVNRCLGETAISRGSNLERQSEAERTSGLLDALL
jgi:hypothetical protein